MARYDLSAPVPDRPKRSGVSAPAAAATPPTPPPPPAPTWRELLSQMDPRRVAAGLAVLLLPLLLVAGGIAWHFRRHVEVDGTVKAQGKGSDVQRCTFLVTTDKGRDLAPARNGLQLNPDGSFHISMDFFAWSMPETVSLRVRLKRHKTQRLAGLVLHDGKARTGLIVMPRGRRGEKRPAP